MTELTKRRWKFQRFRHFRVPTNKGCALPPASNQLFQVLQGFGNPAFFVWCIFTVYTQYLHTIYTISYWRSLESDNLWYPSRRLQKDELIPLWGLVVSTKTRSRARGGATPAVGVRGQCRVPQAQTMLKGHLYHQVY